MIKLNLLPPDIKKNIEYSKKNARLLQNIYIVVLVFTLMVAVMGLLFFVLNNRVWLVNEEKKTLEISLDKYQALKLDGKKLSSRLNLINKINRESINWQLFFDALSSTVPKDLRVDSLEIPLDLKSQIVLSGTARTYNDIVLFRDNLASNNLFEGIDIQKISIGSDPSGGSASFQSYSILFNVKQAELKK